MTEPVVATRRAVAASLEGSGEAPVVVACSGGADSMALAAAAAWVGARSGRTVSALIVDHGLVTGSEAVADAAAQACTALGLDAVVQRVEAASRPGGEGPEASARRARRAALEERARSLGSDIILLGHTRDDQAETVLLQLARGSGARSLAAMRTVSGPYRRPFLDLPRSVVRQSVIDLKLPFHDDPWNVDQRYARVRVRQRVLPVLESELGPGIADALARTAAMLADDSDLLDSLAAEALERAGSEPQTADLAELPRALRTRVIRRLVVSSGCPADALTRHHILAVEHLVVDRRVSGPVDLPGGFAAVRECGRLLITRSSRTLEED